MSHDRPADPADPLDATLRALQGREPQVQDSASALAAGGLLRGLLQERDAEEATTPATPDLRDEALIQRWISGGWLTGQVPQRPPGWRQRLRRHTGLLWSGSGLAVASLALWLFWAPVALKSPATDPGLDNGPAWRGESQSQTVLVDQPEQFALSLQAELEREGVRWRRTIEPGGLIIHLQAKIPLEASTLRVSLMARGIQVPEHGRLDLIVRRAPDH